MDILHLIFCVPKHLSKHPHALLDQIVKERFRLLSFRCFTGGSARAAYSNDLLP